VTVFAGGKSIHPSTISLAGRSVIETAKKLRNEPAIMKPIRL